MRKLKFRRCSFAAVAVLLIAGCQKNEGQAVVLSKEHVAAAEAKPPAPASGDAGPQAAREMARDEIAVDGVVMKKRDRGTSRDPRALPSEQWIVKVRLKDGGRTFNVPAEPSQFERLNEGDSVRVRYSVGKYTDTVWAAEIAAD